MQIKVGDYLLRFLGDLRRGLKTQPQKTTKYLFTCFSVIFTLIKAVTHFIPAVKIEGRLPLAIALLVSAAYALWKAARPSKIEISISNCDTKIEIIVGDLFVQDGIRAIAVSEYFETQLGKPVSERSVHGVFIKKRFAGGTDSLDRQLDAELQGKDFKEHTEKIEGKRKCYAIGTTALINVGAERYLLFAFTKTDPSTCKVWSDLKIMWDSLHNLWERARVEAGGEPVNLPLVGSGLSGLGLPTRDLLNLIILSAITETKAKKITERIRIVLQEDRLGELDLRDLKKKWEDPKNGL